MPTVKIELQQGRDKQVLLKLRDLVMDAVVEVLQLSADDRNVRVIEHAKEFFQMKPPYEILIEIALFTGRSKETKRKLYQTIVNSLQSNEIIEKEKIFILLHEIQQESWGIRGGIPADDVDLGFKINI